MGETGKDAEDGNRGNRQEFKQAQESLAAKRNATPG